ncbi:abortive infection family protein [Picosynechococcus sp. PCC 8807]|uniref:abortive infection family protein n=1 Tax=Picosynechococcus sp. PCC 8807 TaxID=195248 RepID=UPI0030D81136
MLEKKLYNLLVSSQKSAWNGEPFKLELSRCIREYTTSEITQKYGSFRKKEIDSICKLPCIFAYESRCNQDPKFGYITNIIEFQGMVKIEYKIVDIDKFLSHSQLLEKNFELKIDTKHYEMDRTHWSIKEVDLDKELGQLNIQLPLLMGIQPLDNNISTILTSFDGQNIHAAWEKALERRNTDPEAAITMARTLIESVCKHILDEANVDYNNQDELPQLYKKTAKQLQMAPQDYQEHTFKQIFSGCHSVIQGLGTLRNQLSDAHGIGKKAIKPSNRHAELAVNLAGSMAAFLISTWEEQVSKEP